MRPNATQQRLLVLMTTVLTFLGGFLLARGSESGFVAVMAVLALGWFLVVALKPGGTPEG